MKKFNLALLGIAGVLLANTAFASAECPAYLQNDRINQQIFHQALVNKGFDVKTFKVSGNCYELYGISPKGKKVEMYFDMKTGQIIKKEVE